MTPKRVLPGLPDAMRRHPFLGDTLLATALALTATGLALIESSPERHLPTTPADLAGFVLAVIAVAARRRFTVAALGVSVAGVTVLTAVAHHQDPALTAAIVLLTYTVATRTEQRTAWLTAGGVAALLTIGTLVWAPLNGHRLSTIAVIGVGAAIGDATRSRLAYVAEVEQRARQTEQSREEEARHRVAQERIRIARDIHDVIAHHIAAVKVLAAGARRIVDHRPEQVTPALEHISQLADDVLKEMGSVIGLLRHEPDRDVLTIEPTRGLADLQRLIGDFTATGLCVERRQIGVSRELPAMADLVAYRIIQEGLTNARKYGDGRAHLTIEYTSTGLTVDIVNKVGERRSGQSFGYGILGMGERVAANGGRFTVGHAEGNAFSIRAELSAPAP
ncbi:histidine kinase [Pseudosporangium ferrugineum]|nr:histidine kinase [Pseudosporangium ferrugineum]